MMSYVTKYYTQKYEEEYNMFSLKRKYEYYTDRKVNDHVLKGDTMMDDLISHLQYFDSMGDIKRSYHQKLFHKAFLSAACRFIYKEEFKLNKVHIMEKYGFDELSQEVMICCPRRFGKTFSVSMFVACFAIAIPNCTISIFSPGRRQSTLLLDSIEKMIKSIPLAQNMITKKNQENIVLKGSHDNDLRKINGYPSKVETLKGVGGNIIIVEEAAVVDPALFFEVIMPLLQIDDTALLCISTIKSSDNFYSGLLHKKDPKSGKPMFKVHMFYNSCEVCRNSDNPSACVHLKHQLPHWQSSRKHKRLKAFFENNKKLYEQEILGISHDEQKRAFTDNMIETFFSKDYTDLQNKYIQDVFIAIDPSGGGGSDFAISSMIYKDGIITIIGLESFSITKNTHLYETMILSHCKKIRQCYKLKDSRFIFILENNLGLEAAHIERFIKSKRYEIKNFIILREKVNGRIGVMTNANVKEKMYYMLLDILNDNIMYIYKDLICVSNCNKKETLDELRNQMKNYSVVEKNNSAKNPFQRVKRTFTGKISSSSKDDLLITIQLNLFWSTFFRRDDRYKHYRS
jgi:hypothetical protein